MPDASGLAEYSPDALQNIAFGIGLAIKAFEAQSVKALASREAQTQALLKLISGLDRGQERLASAIAQAVGKSNRETLDVIAKQQEDFAASATAALRAIGANQRELTAAIAGLEGVSATLAQAVEKMGRKRTVKRGRDGLVATIE